MRTAKQHVGARGERLAADHLTEQGWKILERNWRCRDGEADLICYDPQVDALVVVEVKTRRGTDYGSPLDAITYEKVRRLRRLVASYAREHRIRTRRLRVDAVGLLWREHRPVQLVHARGIEER